MKKKFFMHGFRLLCAGALLTFGSAQALVTWNGTATDVVNDDLMIQSSSNVGGLPNGTVIHALSQNITVSLAQDIVLTGTQEPGLCLIAEAGFKITFFVDYDLQFTGSAVPLLITVQGPGEVEFVISDDKNVTFAAVNAGQEGARMLVLMGEVFGPTDQAGRLNFSRQSTNSSSNVHINVGLKSIMTYIAPGIDDHENGFITFDSSNTYNVDPMLVGRMELNISSDMAPGTPSPVGTAAGAVYVAGSKVNTYTGCGPLAANIDMTTLAGRRAQFKTINSVGSTATAGLLITNENTVFTELMINPWSSTTPFAGNIRGFVEGANGLITIGQSSYFDYVGLANDFCPTPTIDPTVLLGRSVGSIVKTRNPSAFIVDGTDLQYTDSASASRAQIHWESLFGGTPAGAMVFRSGIDNQGNINWGGEVVTFDFTLTDTANETPGAGEIVFDVEGRLDVINDGDVMNNKIEILSWQVAPRGGSVIINGTETNFPLRTFAQDVDGAYLQYNSACALINNRVNLDHTNLVHTDKNHSVYENDDINSEPTYIGGEKQVIMNSTNDLYRGKIAFYNSRFMIHTCVALTGFDLFVPNGNYTPGMASGFGGTKAFNIINESIFTFFNNGIEYRDGTGRQMILGTTIGSTACDSCCASLSAGADAHLNIYQENDILPEPPSAPNHWLTLNVAPNNSTIMPNVANPVIGQEIQTIYLGHASNISIGTVSTSCDCLFNICTSPSLFVAGDFFSFETRGGNASSPETSAVTGQGGIFVDCFGIFSVLTPYRASIGTMVTKSGTGVVVLPEATVHFKDRVGVSYWQLDLTDPTQRIIVGSGEVLSDYTLNWRAVTKDYSAGFLPFENADYDPCTCLVVTPTYVTSLPVVMGQVEQFQIRGSRLGNAATVAVDNGWIRELIFLAGCDSADTPTAALVFRNHGRVGLGTRDKTYDSNSAVFTLGMNGVTLIADGNGRVDLNEDIIIDNTCHILAGPNMGVGDRLQIFSDSERQILVKKGGVLDLRSFAATLVGTTTFYQTLEFAGNVKLVLEPGAVIALGGGVLRFTDNTRMETSSVHNLAELDWDQAIDTGFTDPFRVKIVGQGRIQLDEDSVFQIGDDAYVGIENNVCFASVSETIDDVTTTTAITDITLEINDRASMIVGSVTGVNNSVFQIGNTIGVRAPAELNTVSFTMILNGADSLFQISSRGFVGLGIGIVNNFNVMPSAWTMDVLSDVTKIDIQVPQGTFKHDRIFSMLDPYASLLAVSSMITSNTTLGQGFYFDYTGPITGDTTQATILGGGNMALISGFTTANNTEIVDEEVIEHNGIINEDLVFGLFSSKRLLDEKTALIYPVSGTDMFTFWATQDLFPNVTIYSNASQDEHNLLSVAYADGGYVVRGLLTSIVGAGGIRVERTDFSHTLEVGAIYGDLGLGLPAPRSIGAAFELP